MSSSSFLLLLRLGVSLAIVMGLIWVAARVLRSRGGPMQFRQQGALVDVVERRPLSRSASVALVRVGGRAMLLGVADGRVDLLAPCPHLDDGDRGDDIDPVSVTPLFPAAGEDEPLTEGSAGLVAPIVALPERADSTPTRRTGSFGAGGPAPSRTGLLDALRDATLRRADAERSSQ